MAKANDNMQLWDSVAKTDPKHTKKVEFGRKFTAIDAHYQVREATRAFGPIGQGWGVINGEPIFTPNDVIIIPVTLWHGSREQTFGPYFGSAELVNKKSGRVDVDAPKKAATDGMTKGLSHLGFSADVFLGLFDDNKYVAETAAEFQRKSDPNYEKANAIMSEMEKIASLGELNGILEHNKDALAEIKANNPALANSVAAVYKKMKSKTGAEA